MNQPGREPSGIHDVAFNAVDLLERNQIGGRASRPYLITDKATLTYQEVIETAVSAGLALLELGLEPGDRVVIATRDRPEFVAVFWGALKAGLVPVPVAPMLSESDYRFILSDSGARAVLCDWSSITAILPATEEERVRCLFAEEATPPEGAISWSDLSGTMRGSLSTAAVSQEAIALWLYTSGTTGLPKAVTHRHRSLMAAPGGLASQVLNMEPDDRVFSASRSFFAYGLGNSIYLPAASGASVVLSAAPVVPALVREVLRQNRPTLVFGVPAFYRGFTALSDAEMPESVRAAVSAGEALDSDLLERFRARFGLPLLDGLGSTEALHHFTSNTPDDVVAGSAGRALAGYEVRACDSEGESVPEGESGELWVRGPTTFAGYWRRPELSGQVLRGEWMRTGDRVRILDGRLYHEGRLDDLMKLGGIWVAPGEVEDVLRGHPDVIDAAVVAVDEGHGVPVLTAYITVSSGGTEAPADLTRLCRTRLATFKIPQVIRVVEELPRTQTGKVRRFVLRGGTSS